MYSILDLFKLMDSNKMSLRCLQHNNVLTLYCQTERKILCVNCTYNDTRHKMHKVYPLKNSLQYVNEDNEDLKELLKNDLKVI